MPRFVFDTGVIVGYVRDAAYAQYIDKKFQPLEPPNLSLISAVSKGELFSLTIQFGWGAAKKQLLQDLLAKLPAVEINRSAILDRYAQIDCYSQGKDATRPLPSGVSARNGQERCLDCRNCISSGCEIVDHR